MTVPVAGKTALPGRNRPPDHTSDPSCPTVRWYYLFYTSDHVLFHLQKRPEVDNDHDDFGVEVETISASGDWADVTPRQGSRVQDLSLGDSATASTCAPPDGHKSPADSYGIGCRLQKLEELQPNRLCHHLTLTFKLSDP
ncbi:unnamed protein product [Taenia asiatica]|uniref:Uncharacterized protein n=1 Tax=Taenia asiatica TaxID=60517 RepID=A0A0R3WFT3_TAEAS|nr:unnamed protein product [Taenia asiatica]